MCVVLLIIDEGWMNSPPRLEPKYSPEIVKMIFDDRTSAMNTLKVRMWEFLFLRSLKSALKVPPHHLGSDQIFLKAQPLLCFFCHGAVAVLKNRSCDNCLGLLWVQFYSPAPQKTLLLNVFVGANDVWCSYHSSSCSFLIHLCCPAAAVVLLCLKRSHRREGEGGGEKEAEIVFIPKWHYISLSLKSCLMLI